MFFKLLIDINKITLLQELPKLGFLKAQKIPCSHTLKEETVL